MFLGPPQKGTTDLFPTGRGAAQVWEQWLFRKQFLDLLETASCGHVSADLAGVRGWAMVSLTRYQAGHTGQLEEMLHLSSPITPQKGPSFPSNGHHSTGVGWGGLYLHHLCFPKLMAPSRTPLFHSDTCKHSPGACCPWGDAVTAPSLAKHGPAGPLLAFFILFFTPAVKQRPENSPEALAAQKWKSKKKITSARRLRGLLRRAAWWLLRRGWARVAAPGAGPGPSRSRGSLSVPATSTHGSGGDGWRWPWATSPGPEPLAQSCCPRRPEPGGCLPWPPLALPPALVSHTAQQVMIFKSD